MQECRRVIVTGASSGIGRAPAVRFAADGYEVCVNARREALLRDLVGSLPPGRHLVCPGDYSDPAVVERMGRTIRESWGSVDVLVNSAGVFKAVDPIESPMAEWRAPLDALVGGAVLVTRMAVPLMKRGGRVVHITSIHGERAEAGASSYAVAKAALNQYCRALALELAQRGILVNAIAPGFIRTPMSILPDGTDETQSAWFLQNYVEGRHLPLRRAGMPEEVAGVAAFLAGPDATYITGHVLVVDGGLSITF